MCDRCGGVFSLGDLQYQYEWAGQKLINKRLRVCQKCMDVPSNAFRTIRIPPDPVPVRDPRPQDYSVTDTPADGYTDSVVDLLFPAPD